jgi:hypothetical protein
MVVETVIASEAKQSIVPHKGRMDCFVASLLAMTVVGVVSSAQVQTASTLLPSGSIRNAAW